MTAAPPSDDAIAFAEQVLTLLRQGAFTSTYKYAVLLGLIELAIEGVSASGAPPTMVTTHQLAEVVVRLYWPQVAPFADAAGGVLRQNTRGQAKIVTSVAAARAELGGGTIARAAREAPARYAQLVREVEWVLVKLPLPLLQRFGGTEARFIYDIAWTDEISQSEFERGDRFANAIDLRPGVGAHLVRLDGLLRPLLHREWALHVAAINRLPVATLDAHLFGVDRVALRPVLAGLRALQDDRCFYCDQRLRAPAVDHFLPWARVALDAIENLVVADPRCNGSKRDHLAAPPHLDRWRQRLRRDRAALSEVADAARWESSPERALGVARGLYLGVRAGARVWSAQAGLIEVADAGALRALLAA